MRPGIGLLLLGCLAFAAQQVLALPPIITVKNLKAKSGPAFRWKVDSHVSSPFNGPVYPGKAGTARVTVDITRTSITKGYVVTGKLLVTNPLQNSQPLSVTGLKASFGPVVPLLAPLPQQLNCPQETLQPGQSLSCSFRVELSSSAANTMTPIVLIKGLPQLQGEPMALIWPSDEEHQLPNGKVVDQESSCALIQMQVAAGDLQPVVRVSTGKDHEDMLQAGLEVCDEHATLAYDVTVGPFDASAGLCGSYVITDTPVVRLAAGSIGSSSTSHTSLPVTIGGCRQKDVLGGHKPSIDITQLTLSKVVTHEWAARPIASTNTSSPAKVKYDSEHAVDVAVHMQRTNGKAELVMSGQVTITNSELLPYILPAQGVRLALSKDGVASSESKHIRVSCPMVGSNIVIGPALDGTPGHLICDFRETVDPAWKQGFVQAQLQTLLSAKHEVDSGEPRAYDFDDKTAVQVMYQGGCVAVNVMRVTNPVDIMSANQNPAVASLARDMGGDTFKLVPMGRVMSGRVPPAASSQADPMVVCGNKTVAWRESYGPFTEYDCGPNMALMGLSARPTTGPGDAVSATLAFPMAVKSCMLKPDVKPNQMRAYKEEAYSWAVHQSRDPKGDVTTNKQKALPVEYKVAYKRTASLGGFKVTGLFKVVNTHSATLNLDEISYSISRPTGAPITGEASCSGTYEDYSDDTAEATGQQRAQTSGDVDASGSNPTLQPQSAAQPTSSTTSTSSSSTKPAAPATKLGRRIRMAAVKYVKVKRQAKGLAVASAVSYEDIEEPEYEEGGNGPLFCSFEAHLPDDHPSTVSLTVVTDDGAKVTEKLGVIDWDSADTTKANKCAMASLTFSTESSTLVKPASIHGEAPPALAVKICEPKTYSFTATFGPWSGPSCCGPKTAVSVATVSLPQSATVITDEEKLHIDVIGCQQALPTLSIEASQHPVKGSFVWSVVRRMTPLGPNRKHPDPAVTVAGPGSPHPEPAVLMLSAKHTTGGYKPGSFAKFNQTITVKRTTPSYEGKEHRFEVKGEVKLVHNGDKPLRLQEVQVKISCDGEGGDSKHKPITVTAICPDHCYDSDYSSAAGKAQTYLTIPSTASAANPIKCHFGAVVPGPAFVSVHAAAVMNDGRKAKAKHSVHLDLRTDDFFKPSTLGSCIRVRESQHVRDLLTGADEDAVLTQGSGIPGDWTEVCKTRTWSTVTRIGPLESHEESGCQAVSYDSNVEAVPSSGYQTALHSSGVVEVHTKSCKTEDGEDGSSGNSGSSENHKKTNYKTGSSSKPKGGSPHKEHEGSSSNKGAQNDEEFWGDMLPKQNKKKKDSSSGYAGKEEDEEPPKGYKDPSAHKGKKDTAHDYPKKPHNQKDRTYQKEGNTYGDNGFTKDGYSGGSKYTPPSDSYGSSGGSGSKAGEGDGDGDEGEGEGEGYDGPEEVPAGGGESGGAGGSGGGPGFPPLPGPINLPIYTPVPASPPSYADTPPSYADKPPLPTLPINSGGSSGSGSGSGSSGGSNAPREGAVFPAPEDSSSATMPSPGGVWLPGLDAAGSSGSGAGSSSSGSSVAEESDDGEGSGEGFDDRKPAQFWKGASKSKAVIPGLRGPSGEKLVTMTAASAKTGQKQPQKQQVAAADVLSPGFWSQLAKEAEPLVAQLAAEGQHKPAAVRPAAAAAAKPAAAAKAAVAAAAPAAKPAQQAAASVAAAAAKPSASQATVSVAAATSTAGAAAPSKPAAAAAAAQTSVSTAAAPAAAAAAGTPAAGHAAPAAAPAAAAVKAQ